MVGHAELESLLAQLAKPNDAALPTRIAKRVRRDLLVIFGPFPENFYLLKPKLAFLTVRQLGSYCLTMDKRETVGKSAFTQVETRVLDATKMAIEKWGVSRFTLADVCDLANVSRATVYRMFPGGKEVLLEALHVRSLDDFFTTLLQRAEGAKSLEDLLVRCVVLATTELRDDKHLAMMLATEPGATLMQFTIDGLSRIVRVAASYLAPLVTAFLPKREADELVEVLSRLVISYFFSPSDRYDFTNEASVAKFLRTHINIHEFSRQ